MRHTALFPDELRDLVIGVIALTLALIIWAVLFVPVAV